MSVHGFHELFFAKKMKIREEPNTQIFFSKHYTLNPQIIKSLNY